MTVSELIEILEEIDGDAEVNLAYQPRYPMRAKASHVKVCNGEVYICQSPYGGNEYAPGCLFDDNESSAEDIGEFEDEDEWEG